MEFLLPGGNKFLVTPSSFEKAMALQKALLRATKGLPLAADPFQMDVSILKDAVVSVATSDEVEKAMFCCMESANYRDRRVSRDLFDDPKIGEQAREDFYLMCWHTAEVNCGPFFKKTFSRLRELAATPAVTPKSS